MVDPLPEPQRYTGHLIRRAQQRHNALWQAEVSEKVSSVQYAVLAILEREPGISQNDLGRHLSLDRSTIADLIRRMRRRGVVSREQDPEDRRRNVLALTEQGRTEFDELRPGVEHVEALLTGGLSADERTLLRGLLQTVLAQD